LPILTYGRKGLGKSGADPNTHAIIFTGEEPPKPLPGEPSLGGVSIRMIGNSKRHKLDEESRLNYAKVYAVEYNVKVYFIGRIHEDYLTTVLAEYKNSQFDED